MLYINIKHRCYVVYYHTSMIMAPLSYSEGWPSMAMMHKRSTAESHERLYVVIKKIDGILFRHHQSRNMPDIMAQVTEVSL